MLPARRTATRKESDRAKLLERSGLPSQCLKKNIPNKDGIILQVPRPEPSRFRKHSEERLEPGAHDPTWGLRFHPCVEIKRSADTNQRGCRYPSQMRFRPILFLCGSETNPNDV